MAENFIVGAICLIIGILLVTGLVECFASPEKTAKNLGSAICEKEYGLDFDWYDVNSNTLTCKLSIQHYNGVRVELNTTRR